MSKSESSYKAIGSKGALAVALSRLEVFSEPKVRVEQYVMDAEIGAEVLWNAHMKGDIRKVSVDLGCGTGILGLGLLLLGNVKVFLVDADEDALKIAKANYRKIKSEFNVPGEAIFVHKDIKNFDEKVNLVVQNPPFGIKTKHADKVFLEKAFEICNLVYSFHKSESKSFISKFSMENNFKISDVWDFNFPLKATQRYHTRKIRRIKVSCFRIVKNSQ